MDVYDESGKVLATVPFLSLLKPSNEPMPNAPEKTIADCRVETGIGSGFFAIDIRPAPLHSKQSKTP